MASRIAHACIHSSQPKQLVIKEKVARPFGAPRFPRCRDLTALRFSKFTLPRRGRFKAAAWPLAPLPHSQFQY